jgi:hypothetical protein
MLGTGCAFFRGYAFFRAGFFFSAGVGDPPCMNQVRFAELQQVSIRDQLTSIIAPLFSSVYASRRAPPKNFCPILEKRDKF